MLAFFTTSNQQISFKVELFTSEHLFETGFIQYGLQLDFPAQPPERWVIVILVQALWIYNPDVFVIILIIPDEDKFLI